MILGEWDCGWFWSGVMAADHVAWVSCWSDAGGGLASPGVFRSRIFASPLISAN